MTPQEMAKAVASMPYDDLADFFSELAKLMAERGAWEKHQNHLD